MAAFPPQDPMINLILDSLAVTRPVAGEQDGELMGHATPEPSPPGQEMVFTSVHWLWEMKKTRAKGSERPLLSAANKLLAWYMWARSWKTCFSARERRSETA